MTPPLSSEGASGHSGAVHLDEREIVEHERASIAVELAQASREVRLHGIRDLDDAALGRFAGRHFRTKGILAVAGLDVRMIVQGVADLVAITFVNAWGDAPRTSRLVVGFGLDRGVLAAGFAACAAGE